MSATTTQLEQVLSSTLNLQRSEEANKRPEETSYRYSHLLPHFSQDHYPPLTPFDHIDPGHRALNHPNPRSFLDGATVVELTPNLGSEVQGVNLAELNDSGRDQIALEVRRPLFSPAVYFVQSFCSRSLAEDYSCSKINKISLTEALNFTEHGEVTLGGKDPFG